MENQNQVAEVEHEVNETGPEVFTPEQTVLQEEQEVISKDEDVPDVVDVYERSPPTPQKQDTKVTLFFFYIFICLSSLVYPTDPMLTWL